MSVSCISMPFRFTIMVAARTACGSRSVTRVGGLLYANSPDPPGMSQTGPMYPGITPNLPPELDNLDLSLKCSNR